jgi:predicted small lipoprotein YifL
MITIRTLAALLAFASLAACGADGAPERPEPRPAQGVTMTGTATVGFAGRL